MAIFGNILIRPQRTFNGLVFDAVLEDTTIKEAQITSNPVEFGTEINDHMIIKPTRYVLRGLVTDTPVLPKTDFVKLANNTTNINDRLNEIFDSSSVQDFFTNVDEFTRGVRAKSAWQVLSTLQAGREPFTVISGLERIENMQIESLRVSQDVSTANSIMFVAQLKQINIVYTAIDQVPDYAREEGETAEQASTLARLGVTQPSVFFNTGLLPTGVI